MASNDSLENSDEELFWGPVTAKEIEWMWRKGFKERQRDESQSVVGVGETFEEQASSSVDALQNTLAIGGSVMSPCKTESTESTPYKNKENEEPKAKKTSSKIPVLAPAKLKINNQGTSEWVLNFKKIVPPKKPNYVISPNKLDNLLKNTPVSNVRRPQTVPNYRTPLTSYNSNKSATPGLKNRTPLATSSSKIKSPVGEYIKIPPPPLVRNVTPTKSNSITNIKPQEKTSAIPKPVVTLTPVYYASASKRVVVPAAAKTPNLPKMGERQTSVLVTPKPQVLKHIGRIKSEEKSAQLRKVKTESALCDSPVEKLPKSCLLKLDTSVVQLQ